MEAPYKEDTHPCRHYKSIQVMNIIIVEHYPNIYIYIYQMNSLYLVLIKM